MTLSILIAHYNNAEYFTDCLDSILKQTCNNFEVVILDDFSSDVEFNTVKNLVKEDTRFKIFRNEKNSGVGFTKRKLLELATGDICGFLDPDDTLMPNAVERMITEHTNHPKASIINSNLNLCDENLVSYDRTKVKQVKNGDPYFFNLHGAISHFVTFKKASYSLTTGIDPYFRIAEDQDIYFKLYEVGESIQIDDVLYNYRKNPNSLTNQSKNEISIYWHWVAIIFAAKRRNINIEDHFAEQFIQRRQVLSRIENFETSFSFQVFRLENKIRSIFKK